MKKFFALAIASACLFTAACTTNSTALPSAHSQTSSSPSAESEQPEISPHTDLEDDEEPEFTPTGDPSQKHEFTLMATDPTPAMENPDMEGALAFAEYYFSNILAASQSLDTAVISEFSWLQCSACVATALVFNSAHHPDAPTLFRSLIPTNAFEGREVRPQHFAFFSEAWDMSYERHDNEFVVYRTFDNAVAASFEVAYSPEVGWRMINYMFITDGSEHSRPATM